MKIIIAAASALSLSILNTFATSQDDAFQKVAHGYVEQYLKANPEQATELGDHRFDGELTDYSSEARAKDLATQKEFRDKLNAIDGSQLIGANNIDFRILKENIEILRRSRTTLIGVGYRTDSPKQHGLDTIEINGPKDIASIVKCLEDRLLR